MAKMIPGCISPQVKSPALKEKNVPDAVKNALCSLYIGYVQIFFLILYYSLLFN